MHVFMWKVCKNSSQFSPLLCHLPILYSFHFLLVGIVLIFVSLMCVGGLWLFKNAVDAVRRVLSSWVNVMEVCLS
jgi:hypothetical protein